MELPEDAIERLLDAWPVARLATTGPAGPHLVPVVFARAAGFLWSPVDAKPKGGGELARVRHVRAEPRVALLLDHYEADWGRLWWLRVDAEAAVVAAAEPAAVAALERKYPQYREIPVLREPPVLLRLRPLARRGWCAGRDAVPTGV